MKKFFPIIFRCIISFIIGCIFNKVFTSVNTINGLFWEIKYEIPFIYVLSIDEIILILFIINIFTALFLLYYKNSEYSKKEIRNIYKIIFSWSCILFSFVIGTQFFTQENNINLEIYRDLIIVIQYLLLVSLSSYSFFLENSEDQENTLKDLYPSRKKFLNTMENFLDNMNSFSIIGDWGIGKTVLIENFFYNIPKDNEEKNYEEKYRLIYIDVSIYADNKKIIESIEKELDSIFSEYKILNRNKNFIDELFLQENNILKNIYLYIFSKSSLKEYKQNLKQKVKELKKEIVLCLDNLERLNSKERITNLFAIVDEILCDDIKKIYVYDENHMIEIFKRENKDDFIKYIEKYTFNKIELKEVEMEEIISNLVEKEKFNKILSNFNSYCGKIRSKVNKIIKEYFDSQKYKNINEFSENIKDSIIEIIDRIQKNLKNPRYMENLIKYLNDKSLDSEKLKYKFEYKIIRDFLTNITLENMLYNSIENISFFNKIKWNSIIIDGQIDLFKEKLNLKELDELCFLFLFKSKLEDGNISFNITDRLIKEDYYESFFLNTSLDKSKNLKKLKEYEDKPEQYLPKIIELMINLYPRDYLEKIKSYLESLDSVYVVNNSGEFLEIFNSYELEEYSEELFSKIELNELGKYEDGGRIETLEVYHDTLQKSYILHNTYIKHLIQKIYKKEIIDVFFKTVPLNFDNFLKEISKDNINDFINELKIKLEENKSFFMELGVYDKINKSLKTEENFIKLKKCRREADFLLTIQLEDLKNIYYYTKKDILKLIIINKEKFILKTYDRQIIVPYNEIKKLKEQLKKYLKEDKNLSELIITILIEIEKYEKSKNIERIE